MFLLFVKFLTLLVFLDLFPPGKERCHWLILVRIRVRISKFDVNDGNELTIPYTLDHHIFPYFLVLVTALTYLLLGSGTALMY